MPTLPLYETPAHRDAWHRVVAPGGYEWWHFDAEDARRGLRVQVDFFDGDPFDPLYLRAYRRYRRRPTRVPPPVPRDYPCVRCVVLENGRPLWSAERRFPPGAFQGSELRAEFSVGTCSVRPYGEGGGLQLSLEGLSPDADGSSHVVRLTFQPLESRPPELRRFDADERSAVDHWLVAGSMDEVVGTLQLGDGSRAGDRMFEGRGRYDHFYGSGPMGGELRRLVERLRDSKASPSMPGV